MTKEEWTFRIGNRCCSNKINCINYNTSEKHKIWICEKCYNPNLNHFFVGGFSYRPSSISRIKQVFERILPRPFFDIVICILISQALAAILVLLLKSWK